MDEYMGIIKLFAGNFAPQNWAFCNGQILSIASNTALFSLLGTTYGGDGQTTFALPDLRSRVPVGATNGQGAPGLTPISEGQIGGEETHTLLVNEMPAHNHALLVNNTDSTQAAATSGASIATPGAPAGRGINETYGFNTANPNTNLNNGSIGATGSTMPHNNMQPYLGLNYIICTSGLYPPRS